jgi:hypothetical protein
MWAYNVAIGQTGKRGRTHMSVPIWIYFVIAGVLISAFMALKTAKEDRDDEMEWIEKEGEVYMNRLEEEKERRKQVTEAG